MNEPLKSRLRETGADPDTVARLWRSVRRQAGRAPLHKQILGSSGALVGVAAAAIFFAFLEITQRPPAPVTAAHFLQRRPEGGEASEGATAALAPGSERAKHSPEPPARESAWRSLAREGKFALAWSALGETGVSRAAVGAAPDTIGLLADIASAGGDLLLAKRLLRGVIASPAASALERSVAAYSLGLKCIEAGDFLAAASSFDESLALGLPEALRHDARQRSREARARSDNALAQSGQSLKRPTERAVFLRE